MGTGGRNVSLRFPKVQQASTSDVDSSPLGWPLGGSLALGHVGIMAAILAPIGVAICLAVAIGVWISRYGLWSKLRSL